MMRKIRQVISWLESKSNPPKSSFSSSDFGIRVTILLFLLLGINFILIIKFSRAPRQGVFKRHTGAGVDYIRLAKGGRLVFIFAKFFQAIFAINRAHAVRHERNSRLPAAIIAFDHRSI